MTRFTDEHLETLCSLPGLGSPMGTRLLLVVLSRPLRLMLRCFTLCPRATVDKNLSLATRCKGHIEKDFHTSMKNPWISNIHMCPVPDVSRSILQLGGAWASCRQQQGVLLSRKRCDRQILHAAYDISYCHSLSYFLAGKVSGQPFYCFNL